MDPNNQRPNPVEDYMQSIMSDNPSPAAETVSSDSQEAADTSATTPKGPIQSEITGKAFAQRRPVFDPTGRIEQINDSEIKVADVRRHPFGLIVVYIQTILAIGLSIGMIVLLLPSVVGNNNQGADLFIAALVLFMTIFGGIFLILATRIYSGNQLIITDINVTQVHQVSLFNRKVSELTMANVEDVTANTNGLFPTIFNYGILTIETAGEQNNFIFKYCPNPNAYAKALQDARALFMQKHGGH